MEGVKFEHIGIAHEDSRRALIEVVSGDFVAKQIKIIKVNSDSVLGNHYHPYRQFFYLMKGEADYTFVNVDTNERTKIKMRGGDKITIAKRIAHKALMKKGNETLEGNEEAYTSPEIDDLRYEIN
jgi:mannose-6-phosphate isomerase-like protein (cupin superfamily)